MEDRAPVVSEVSQPTTQCKRESRGAWVLTAYCISGLILFGLIAYFISDFLAH